MLDVPQHHSSNCTTEPRYEDSMMLAQRWVDERNRRYRNKPTLLWWLIFDKAGKKRVSLTNCVGKTGHPHIWDWKFTKINPKWIKDLNVRPELWNWERKTLDHINIGNAFLNRTPIAQKIKTRIEMQIKKPLHSKGDNSQN
jgi:hypothetical protein